MADALSQRAFATLAGVSHTAIGKAVRAGHLVEGEGGRLDPDEAQNASWLARHRDGGRSIGIPIEVNQGGHSTLNEPGPPEAETIDGAETALFSDWSGLRIDNLAADRLLREVPGEPEDQIGFLCLMMEGLRAALGEALAAQAEETRAELLALWQAALGIRRDLGEVTEIIMKLAGLEPAAAAIGVPESDPLREPGPAQESQ
jgi:hypothetical protein